MNDLKLESYNYELPDEFIASRPVSNRSESKLLVYYATEERVEHKKFHDIKDILPSDSLLVLNESKVFPCRLIGHKSSGGKCEVFLLSLLHKDLSYPALIKTSGKKNRK